MVLISFNFAYNFSYGGVLEGLRLAAGVGIEVSVARDRVG